MIDTAVVRPHIVAVEEQSFLYYARGCPVSELSAREDHRELRAMGTAYIV